MGELIFLIQAKFINFVGGNQNLNENSSINRK